MPFFSHFLRIPFIPWLKTPVGISPCLLRSTHFRTAKQLLELKGSWSRRSNDEHPLVYKTAKESLIILSRHYYYCRAA